MRWLGFRFLARPLWIGLCGIAAFSLAPRIAEAPTVERPPRVAPGTAHLTGGPHRPVDMRRSLPAFGPGGATSVAASPTPALPAPPHTGLHVKHDLDVLYGSIPDPASLAPPSNLVGSRLILAGGTRVLAPGAQRVEGTTIYAVQFDGPIREADKQRIRARGATLLKYTADYTFVSRLSPDDVPFVAGDPRVRAVAPLLPADRIQPPLVDLLSSIGPTDTFQIRVVVWPDVDPQAMVPVLRNLGVAIGAVVQHEMVPFVEATAHRADIGPIARLEDVQFIEPIMPATVLNEESVPTVQSGYTLGGTPIHDHGITGTGQLITEMDSGVDMDHAMFADSPTVVGTPDPGHRKVEAYGNYGGNTSACNTDDHGTHVAGTALGNATDIGMGNGHDGVAPGARLIMQDVMKTGGCMLGSLSIPSSLTTAFTDSRDAGSRIHTNSWGSNTNTYTTYASEADTFMWNNKTFLLLYASGNDGMSGGTPVSGSVNSPGTAKNIVTVGGHDSDPNQFRIYAYTGSGSSRGPASPSGSARRKPTVMTPATDSDGFDDPTADNTASGNYGIASAASDNNSTVGNALNDGWSGTSMATPAAAGSAALVRDYLAQGFYPTGTANGGDAMATPSSALIRAVLISSTERLFDVADRPSNDQGWGRVVLDNSLFFCGETRRLFLDDSSSVDTGGSVQYDIDVTDTSEELRVVLTWTDYPGDTLVNNLDLTVTDGTNTYKGSVFSGGYSVTGGTADATNPDEAVFIRNPVAGTYTVTVAGTNVPMGEGVGSVQPFALVATGGFDTVNSARLPGGPRSPTLIAPVDNTRSGITAPTVQITSTDPESDSISYTLEWDTDPSFSSPSSQAIGPVASGGTASYGLGTPLTGGMTYFRARAIDASGDNCTSPDSTWHYVVQSGRAVDGWLQVVGSQFARDSLVDTMPGSLLLAPDYGTNLSLGGTAAGQTERAGYPATNANDGDSATVWANDVNLPQWLEVDLGADTDVGAMILDFGYYVPANTPSDFDLQVSSDGSTYTTVGSVVDGQDRAYLFVGYTRGRYVRINILQNRVGATNSPVAVAELETYGFLSSGTAAGTPISLSDFPQAPTAWQQLRSEMDTANGTIALQVEYDTGGGVFALVPDGTLSGNSTGFSSFPVDISALTDAGGYGTLRVRATLTNTTGTPRLFSWALEPLGAPTVATVSGLAAAYRAESADVEVSWRLESSLGVMAMRVTRSADFDHGPWEAVADVDPDPGAVGGPYAVVDPSGRADLAYRLEVDRADGTTEIYGPVRPSGAPAAEPRGCACALGTRRAPSTVPGLLFVLGALFVVGRRRRSR